MKQTVIICDQCHSRLYGTNYSSLWSKAKKKGWTYFVENGRENHRMHICGRCNAEKPKQEGDE